MHRNDGANVGPGNSFVAGDPQTGVPGTQPAPTYMTELQEEICGAVEGVGLTLVKGDATQVRKAIAAIAQGLIGRRNLLHNGDFVVQQRVVFGSSLALIAGQVGYPVDRWRYSPGTGAGAGSAIRASFLGVFSPVAPRFGIEIVQSAGGTAPYFEQRIEHVWTVHNQVCTLSLAADVIALGSGTSLAISTEIVQRFGSGGSADVTTAGPTFTVPLAGSGLVRFSGQVTLPTIVGKTIGTESSIAVRLKFPSSLTFTVDLSAIQFEVGAVATPFEVRPSTTEWEDCRRFYWNTAAFSSSLGFNSSVGAIKVVGSGTDARPLDQRFPSPMRKAGSVTWYAPSSGSSGNIDWEAGVRAVTAQFDSSAESTGWPRVGASRAMSALEAHCTVDAELP